MTQTVRARSHTHVASRVDAAVSNEIVLLRMLKLQRKDTSGPSGRYYFLKSDVAQAMGTAKGHHRLGLEHFKRYFDAHPGVTRAGRDDVMRWIRTDVSQPIYKAAGTDLKLTQNEAKKLPKYLKDEYDFLIRNNKISP